jgi:hypothetical protein
MSSLETAQNIWEKSTEIFDKIEDSEKKEWFNNLIDQFEDNSTINRLKKTWNSMTEEQKLKIYKRHSISVSTRLRYSNMFTFWIGEKVYHGTKNYMKEWKENALKYATLEEIPCRFLIHLGLLEKPKWLTDEKLKEDIKKDAKNFDIYLNICEKTCLVFWEKALSSLITVARFYTKRYKKDWVDTIIERLNKKKKIQIEEQTSEELSSTMSDIKSKEKAA